MTTTSMSTPPVGPRGLAVRCALQGEAAWQGGAQLTACPYGPDRPYAQRAWVRGYVFTARAAGAVLPAQLADATDEDAPPPQ